MIANNKTAMRIVVAILTPIQLIVCMLIGMWEGLVEGISTVRYMWKYPTDNRWNKKRY